MDAAKILLIDDDPHLADVMMDSMLNCDRSLELQYSEKLNTDNLDILDKDYDFIFLDYYRTDQLKTPLVLNHLKENSQIDKTVVYSSHFNQELYNILHAFNIHSYIPRGASHKVLNSIINETEFKEVENLESQTQLDESLTVKQGKYYYKINLKEVEFLEVGGNYVYFHYKGKKLMFRESMKNIIQRFPDIYIRIHAKYAINKDFFTMLDYVNKHVHLENNKLPLGRKYQKAFYEYLEVSS